MTTDNGGPETKKVSLKTCFALSERVALVTGAAGNLGAAIARSLAEAGAKVYLCGRNSDSIERLCADLTSDGYPAVAAPFDVADETRVQEFVTTLATTDQRLD